MGRLRGSTGHSWIRFIAKVEAGQRVLIHGAAAGSVRMAEVRQAHELSQTGHGRGRIILHITD